MADINPIQMLSTKGLLFRMYHIHMSFWAETFPDSGHIIEAVVYSSFKQSILLTGHGPPDCACGQDIAKELSKARAFGQMACSFSSAFEEPI